MSSMQIDICRYELLFGILVTLSCSMYYISMGFKDSVRLGIPHGLENAPLRDRWTSKAVTKEEEPNVCFSDDKVVVDD